MITEIPLTTSSTEEIRTYKYTSCFQVRHRDVDPVNTAVNRVCADICAGSECHLRLKRFSKIFAELPKANPRAPTETAQVAIGLALSISGNHHIIPIPTNIHTTLISIPNKLANLTVPVIQILVLEAAIKMNVQDAYTYAEMDAEHPTLN